jgi:membrane-bound lytic murein transglycosylase D
VGFWQLKDFTAREVGLMVDQRVDERKHIFRASVGAAKYFRTNYLRYQNWVYSIISYYAGGTGAKPYTEEKYYGQNVMTITSDLHWYAKKAIAHKIAFEDAIRGADQPKLFLVPKSNEGELAVEQLAQQADLPLKKFKDYNLWIEDEQLPASKPFSYYVPSEYKPALALNDPHRELYKPEQKLHLASNQQKRGEGPSFIKPENDRPAGSGSRRGRRSEFLPEKANGYPQPPAGTQHLKAQKSPYYGEEFIRVQKHQTLEHIAGQHGLRARQLRRWNYIKQGKQPPAGMHLALVRPRRSHIHVARKWETLLEIAARYRRNPERLAELNNIGDVSELLLPGQKIYLKNPKPADEPTIVFHFDEVPGIGAGEEEAAEPQQQEAEAPQSPKQARQQPAAQAGSPNANPAQQQASAQPARSAQSTAPASATKQPAEAGESAQARPAAQKNLDQQPGEKADKKAVDKASNKASGKASEKAPASTGKKPSEQAGAKPAQRPEAAQSGAATASPKQQAPKPASQGPAYYTVQAGDTLFSIAQAHDTSPGVLRKLNDLQGNTIHPGQRLRIE